jgi:hypothetical protein
MTASRCARALDPASAKCRGSMLRPDIGARNKIRSLPSKSDFVRDLSMMHYQT